MTRLLIARHGKAEEAINKPDEQRSLTAEGAAQLEQAAIGLKKIGVALNRVVCSPLVRTDQTATIFVTILAPRLSIKRSSCLEPGAKPQRVVDELLTDSGVNNVLLVGHMPDVAELARFLLREPVKRTLHFPPGTVACIDFPQLPEKAAGQLQWLLTWEQASRGVV